MNKVWILFMEYTRELFPIPEAFSVYLDYPSEEQLQEILELSQYKTSRLHTDREVIVRYRKYSLVEVTVGARI